MDEMNVFVHNEGKFYKEDQETVATAWREFFSFCCLILPENLDVYALMQKSFPMKYELRKRAFTYHYIIKDDNI